MATSIRHLKDDPSQAANLYSLLYTLEYLERAYIGGYLQVDEYETECQSLLSLCTLLNDASPDVFHVFAKEFQLNFPLALNRIKIDRPATLAKNPTSSKNQVRDTTFIGNIKQKLMIFELSEHFITLIDALKLGSVATDELYPLVHELIISVKAIEESSEKLGDAISDLDSMNKLQKWHNKLQGMDAHEELGTNEIRQMNMDIEASYSSFKSFLRKQK